MAVLGDITKKNMQFSVSEFAGFNNIYVLYISTYIHKIKIALVPLTAKGEGVKALAESSTKNVR